MHTEAGPHEEVGVFGAFCIVVFQLQGDSGLYPRRANQVREDFPEKYPSF